MPTRTHCSAGACDTDGGVSGNCSPPREQFGPEQGNPELTGAGSRFCPAIGAEAASEVE